MAKKVVTLEICDQCGKEAGTHEIVIHLPGEQAKVYDLCNIDYDALLAITGGTEYFAPNTYSGVTEEQAMIQDKTKLTAVRGRQAWDREETQFLIDNPLMSHEDAALKLKRTYFAVRTHRSNLRKQGHIV